MTGAEGERGSTENHGMIDTQIMPTSSWVWSKAKLHRIIINNLYTTQSLNQCTALLLLLICTDVKKEKTQYPKHEKQRENEAKPTLFSCSLTS